MVSPILVGREAHLAALESCFDDLPSGRGHVLLLTGEAGIGKTRLIAEARARAVTRGLRVLQGRCFETDRLLPYAPFQDLLRDFAAAEPTVSQTLPEMPGVGELDDRESAKRRAFQAFDSLFAQLASIAPLVVVLEDMHWVDELSAELVRYIARGIPNRSLLLVMTYRPDDVHLPLRELLAGLDRERIASELTFEPLDAASVDSMLRAIFDLDRPVRPDFLELIARLSEGNPFFIEEILRALIARGEVYLEEGHWDRKPLPDLHVPRSVSEAVSQRTARLSQPAAHALRLAAVAGRRFGFGLLEALSGQDEMGLLESVRELVRAGLVVEESPEQFAFRHALTREAVYGALLGRERRALHRRVADTIRTLHSDMPTSLDDHLELGHHYHEAGAWAHALEFGARAGGRALDLYAPQAAIDQFTRALDAADHLRVSPSPEVLRARGRAYEMLGVFDRALEDLESAAELGNKQSDVVVEWRAQLDLGLLWAGRDYARAGEHVQRALDIARGLNEPASVAHSLNRLGNWQMNVGQISEAMRCHGEALEIFQTLGDQRGIAETLDLLGVASHEAADPVAAAGYYDRAIPLLRELDDRQRLVNAMVMRTLVSGSYFLDLGAPALARESQPGGNAEEALRIARDIGWRAGEAFACWELAVWLGPRGEYARALEMAHAGLAIAEDIDHRQWQAAAHCALSAIHLDLLDPATARAEAEEALELAKEIGSPAWRRVACGLWASACVAQRDADLVGVAGALNEILDHATSTQTMGHRLCLSARAELALAQKQPSEALAILDRLDGSRIDARPPHVLRVRAQALLALGRVDEAETTLLDAQHATHASEARCHAWRISAALGRVYALQRRAADANAAYADARSAIEKLAVNVPDDGLRDGFVQRASRDLPAPRAVSEIRAAKHRFDGLTARERQVAGLVARGLSNRAIADELIVGERTIETYVSNILSKLGYTSRVQIAAWAVDKGLATSS